RSSRHGWAGRDVRKDHRRNEVLRILRCVHSQARDADKNEEPVMSFWECPKCGGIPGVTFCCSDEKPKPADKPTAEWKPIETAPQGTLLLFYNAEAADVPSSMFTDWVVDRQLC